MANQPQIFKYGGPNRVSKTPGKSGAMLCKSDLVKADVKVLAMGTGENQLHYHTGNDGFWMVLEGSVRFYGAGDVVIADLGKHEGILIPRGFRYWFSGTGDEPLQILHVAAKAQDTEDVSIGDKSHKVAIS